uniref:G_PROTEIN_RECEP_F1_2 domain-containing protein n=1 Tax=Strongyloides venezuelensis TaxID=75913 RepID=A0A0K0F3B5_STRVS
MYFNGAKKGRFICKYLFDYTYKEEHFILIALVHSLIVISIILTIMTIYKIKKLNKASNESSVIAVKKRNKEKRMTRYVLLLGIVQLIRLIEEHFYYIEIKINGYDESISYIMMGFDPFVGVFWIFLNAISIISISKTLRDAVFKNLKVDILYKKLFKENVVAPSSHNPNIIQSVNRGIKNKTLI